VKSRVDHARVDCFWEMLMELHVLRRELHLGAHLCAHLGARIVGTSREERR
jgi:hypothetical protein